MGILPTLLLLSLPAAAQTIPACVSESSQPASYEALLACQARKKETFVRDFERKNSATPPPELLDYINAAQKREASEYLKNQEQKPPAAKKSASRVESDGEDIADIEAYLRSKSNGGKNGVTPEMADYVRRTLSKKQGGVSPEMDKFLSGVSKDGGTLTPETMDTVKEAARKADLEGLELQLDPAMKKALLDVKEPR